MAVGSMTMAAVVVTGACGWVVMVAVCVITAGLLVSVTAADGGVQPRW